jgi:CheY-like chemotaxis protein
MRGDGCRCFCTEVFRGPDGRGVTNFLDYQCQSPARETLDFLQSQQFEVGARHLCRPPLHPVIEAMQSSLRGCARVALPIEAWLCPRLLSESGQNRAPAALPVAAAQAVGRVLLVDDEYLVRASTAGMLGELGYDVVEAASAEEALRLLESEPRIDGIITDHLMPGMSGVDLAHAIRVKRPGMPVLLLSGFAGAGGMDADLPLLAKPFRQSNLAATLAALLQQAAK